ncbi:hypothetical protein [Actibacterium sp. 188UL27-1]|uniref:hypothetical protein n=1 Tax=Actibacterium sp. 188UL27-1 TaxID=2786961 RepID=UPI00195CEEA5|nr:hypothetical protein [Actibacterium sp. 188UL27-1]MBM7069188.1 hypothetical protein [Actibacterium sp. 188UL27-1]
MHAEIQDLRDLCTRARQWAWSVDVKGPRDVRRIAILWAWLGVHPDADPRFADVLGPSRIRKLYQDDPDPWGTLASEVYQTYLETAPDQSIRLNVARNILANPNPDDTDILLADLLSLSPIDCDLAEILNAAHQASMPYPTAPSHRLLAVLQGPFWHQNPLNSWLICKVERAPIEPETLHEYLSHQVSLAETQDEHTGRP